jgi:hypothetical protein
MGANLDGTGSSYAGATYEHPLVLPHDMHR